MGLRGKIIGLFFICFGLMALLAMTILRSNLAAGFMAIEHRQAADQMQQLTRSLNNELDRLNQVAFDWAAWDDVYNYVKHPTPEFAQHQFAPSALKEIEVRLFVVLDPQGKPVFSEAINLKTGQAESAAIFDTTVENIKKIASLNTPVTEKTCGIDLTTVGPILVCWKTIRKSDLSGEPNGTVVIGRMLSKELLDRIRMQSNIEFDLTPLPVHDAGAGIAPGSKSIDIEAGKIEFSQSEVGVLNGQLTNIVGQPILQVRLQFPNDVSRRGEELTWKVLRVLMLVTILTGLALLASVHVLIIRRLRKMDMDLSSIWRNGRWAGRLEALPYKDELNDLSHSINRMLALIRKQVGMLETIALTDPLTQIANRRAFDERLEVEMSLHKRNQTPLSLLIVDVDFFKRYNDLYGHPAGDDILKALGKLLSEVACRPSDLPARIGGEEFAVILPSTNLEGATHVAEMLARKLGELKMPHEDSPISGLITLCIGVTTAQDEEISSFVQRADKAMYNAKQTGRDKICVLAA